ncbi:MAG: M1 family metallopeptidase [Flavobacteriales bacterium]
MKNLLFLFSFILLSSSFSNAQAYDPLNSPNSYRSKGNPHYWKNRPPHPGYWQQDVHYTIKATIDEASDIISGELHLVYTNNSPDDLPFVYFHLYQEAFQPGSYYDKLNKANGNYPNYGPYEKQGLGTKVESVIVNGHELKTEQDNTILKVFLEQPIKSGTSGEFHIKFKTYFDNTNGVGRRFKKFTTKGYKHYDGVHWYPRITVYDRKFGWCTDQHLGKEFYGDFGCYDVELNFSSNYVVEATGNLTNREEVLPKDLRDKLDIRNFTQPIAEKNISEPIPYDPNQRKTWKYHAENVHDFAFTADPTYRIGEATWNGVSCISVAQEHHAWKWQNAAEYAAKVIEVYSRDFGMYVYHKMVVADARDGMEYPMLTLDGGFDPDYRGLLAHEIGHNWFFGQVGNNETYRACLDEGFTQFLTAWAQENIDGDTIQKSRPQNKYTDRFKHYDQVRESAVFNGYLRDAIQGDDAVLNTHSDDFGSALGHGGGYRHSYYKTASMLYNLQYVLGDDLFLAAMKNYFDQWKIAHPYVEDFRNSIIQYTKVDLNWFFDQWFETKKTIDYVIVKARYGKEKNKYLVTFRRKGEMQMPIDFVVEGENDSMYYFHIPNTWFVKQTNATVLPKWTGWGKLNEEYTAEITVPVAIRDIRIDPSHRLADVDQLNNNLRFPVHYEFDSRIRNNPDIHRYEVFVRPELWYNGYDGLKPGVHVNGNYMNYKHIFDVTLWINTGFGHRIPQNISNYEGVNNEFDPISLRLNYKTGLNKFFGKSNFLFSGAVLDGLKTVNTGIEKWNNKRNIRMYGMFKLMYRKDTADLNYLFYPGEWMADKFNNTLNFGIDKNYEFKGGSGKVNFNLRSTAVGSDYSYGQFSMTSIHRFKIWKTRLSTRLLAQYGTGSAIPSESALFLAGANPEEMMNSKYTRSIGFFPYEWTGNYGASTNHFHAGGGLNLRGYAGYLIPDMDSAGNLSFHYKGNSGASFSAELDLRDIVKWKPKKLSRYFGLDIYLFTDAGIMAKEMSGKRFDFASFRADAGVGTALTIKRFGPLEMVEPLVVRFDMPLFLNVVPYTENYFQFRYVVGVSRSF